MEKSEQLKVVEALVLASPEPLSASRIAQITPECTPALAKDLVAELNEQYVKAERAFEIWEIAGGYQVRTRAEFSGYLQKLQKQRPLRLSSAALETLSIVAYKQPATRAEIENVRGVDAGPVMKSLLERGLVKITGQKEVPGRPMLYGTTRRFLEVFGLDSLKQLPALRELEDLAREHGLQNPDSTETTEPEASEAVDDAELVEAAEAASENLADELVDEAEEAEVDGTQVEDHEAAEPEIMVRGEVVELDADDSLNDSANDSVHEDSEGGTLDEDTAAVDETAESDESFAETSDESFVDEADAGDEADADDSPETDDAAGVDDGSVDGFDEEESAEVTDDSDEALDRTTGE
ncbi:MAG: segregation and condensation protein B [Myxococcota bacterium]|jgi:segregation and condensation protein B